jgi:hypothetical protein
MIKIGGAVCRVFKIEFNIIKPKRE